jgi:two-component system, NtrC family, response regulator HydG
MPKNRGTPGCFWKGETSDMEIWMKANILVIDDEESIRFSFSRFLAAEGHNVITAKDYREALARMDETEFELILADNVLGDGWGMDILLEVLQRNLKTRVIIMTAYPSTETAQDSFRMHAADYLVKPLKQGRLIDSVNKALHQKKNGTSETSSRDSGNQATL